MDNGRSHLNNAGQQKQRSVIFINVLGNLTEPSLGMVNIDESVGTYSFYI